MGMPPVGFQRGTADFAVGASGKAVAVFGVFIDSGSGGAGSVSLKNGSSTAGTEVVAFAGSAADALQYFNLCDGVGVVFPSGCFADIGANTDAVVVFYTRVG